MLIKDMFIRILVYIYKITLCGKRGGRQTARRSEAFL